MNTHKYISIYNKAWSVEVPTCDKCRERKQPVTILSKYPFGRLSLHIHHPLQTLACINYVFESPLRQKSITVSPESMHSFNRRARYGPGPKPWPGEEKTNSRGHCSLFWCLCVPTLFWMLQSFEGESVWRRSGLQCSVISCSSSSYSAAESPRSSSLCPSSGNESSGLLLLSCLKDDPLSDGQYYKTDISSYFSLTPFVCYLT